MEKCKLYLIALDRVRQLRRVAELLGNAADDAARRSVKVGNRFRYFKAKSKLLGIDVRASSPSRKDKKVKGCRKSLKTRAKGDSLKPNKFNEEPESFAQIPGNDVGPEDEVFASGYVRLLDGAEVTCDVAIKMCPAVAAAGTSSHVFSDSKVRKSD